MVIAWIGGVGHTAAIRRALRFALPILVSAAYATAPLEAVNYLPADEKCQPGIKGFNQCSTYQ